MERQLIHSRSLLKCSAISPSILQMNRIRLWTWYCLACQLTRCAWESHVAPPVAGVWWAHWRRCPVAAVASSKWMLHTGGGWGETPPPHMIVKHFGCTAIHNKALYKCIIHSFIHIQNAAVRLVFNEPKRAHVTPLFYLLALATCCSHASSSRHWWLHIEQPQSQHPPTSTHYYKSTSSRSLRSASERRLVVPSQRDSKSLSRTFSFTVPGRWNDLRTRIRNAGSLSIFKQQLKTHLVRHYST